MPLLRQFSAAEYNAAAARSGRSHNAGGVKNGGWTKVDVTIVGKPKYVTGDTYK